MNDKESTGPTKISELLPHVIESLGIDENIKLEKLRSLWHTVTDQTIAKYSQPSYLDKDGNLVVAVSNSPLATELSMQSTSILHKLKKAVNDLDIDFKSVRFIVKPLS